MVELIVYPTLDELKFAHHRIIDGSGGLAGFKDIGGFYFRPHTKGISVPTETKDAIKDFIGHDNSEIKYTDKLLSLQDVLLSSDMDNLDTENKK